MSNKQVAGVLRLVIGIVVIALWFVVNQAAYVANQRAEAANQEVEKARAHAQVQLAQSDSHLYELLLKHIEKSKSAGAIQVDTQGKIVWLNEFAKTSFDLVIGDHIEQIMVSGQRAKHHEGFEKAMVDHQSGTRRALSNIYCQAKTRSGILPVHVESWSVPNGAMAYITVVDSEPSNKPD